MSASDKIKNSTKEFLGKAKEFAGDATDNRKLETEGREDQQEAKLQQAGEHVKDGLKDAGETFKK